MDGASVHSIRMQIGYTQRLFATLLGVHPLTVSRWECDVLVPAPNIVRLLEAIQAALQQDPERLPSRLYALRGDPLRALAAVLSVLHPDVAAESVVSRADAEAILASVRTTLSLDKDLAHA